MSLIKDSVLGTLCLLSLAFWQCGDAKNEEDTPQNNTPVATKSVGEKASPLPLLSTGASVIISVPD